MSFAAIGPTVTSAVGADVKGFFAVGFASALSVPACGALSSAIRLSIRFSVDAACLSDKRYLAASRSSVIHPKILVISLAIKTGFDLLNWSGSAAIPPFIVL